MSKSFRFEDAPYQKRAHEDLVLPMNFSAPRSFFSQLLHLHRTKITKMSFAMVPLEIDESPKTPDPTLPPYSPIGMLSRRAPDTQNLDSLRARQTATHQQDLEAAQNAQTPPSKYSWIDYALGFFMVLILVAFMVLAIVRRNFYRRNPSGIEANFTASVVSFALGNLLSLSMLVVSVASDVKGLRLHLVGVVCGLRCVCRGEGVVRALFGD